MEFVGEMLGRTDLDEASNPITDIREDEAIELAEQLSMISTTEAIRLRNGQTLVNHFLDPEVSQSEQMHREEAISVVRSCVINFLAEPNEKTRQPFLELRETGDGDAQGRRPRGGTPRPVALFLHSHNADRSAHSVESRHSAKLEHAAGNINVLLPVIWRKLRDKDRWQSGETYAMVQAADRPVAAAGFASTHARERI